jgi:hypothetical protein
MELIKFNSIIFGLKNKRRYKMNYKTYGFGSEHFLYNFERRSGIINLQSGGLNYIVEKFERVLPYYRLFYRSNSYLFNKNDKYIVPIYSRDEFIIGNSITNSNELYLKNSETNKIMDLFTFFKKIIDQFFLIQKDSINLAIHRMLTLYFPNKDISGIPISEETDINDIKNMIDNFFELDNNELKYIKNSVLLGKFIWNNFYATDQTFNSIGDYLTGNIIFFGTDDVSLTTSNIKKEISNERFQKFISMIEHISQMKFDEPEFYTFIMETWSMKRLCNKITSNASNHSKLIRLRIKDNSSYYITHYNNILDDGNFEFERYNNDEFPVEMDELYGLKIESQRQFIQNNG